MKQKTPKYKPLWDDYGQLHEPDSEFVKFAEKKVKEIMKVAKRANVSPYGVADLIRGNAQWLAISQWMGDPKPKKK